MMKKIFLPLFAVFFVLAPCVGVGASVLATATVKKLPVPYVSEVPDGKWVGSWKNACEEASIAMVDRYYSGVKTVSIAWSKAYMNKLFAIERKLWGSDANTDAAMTARLIDEHSSFSARLVEGVTIDDLKNELDAGRPVIVPINGFTLDNKNIPFLPSGSAYHMFVIVGYDDATRDFIVNDTGDPKLGAGIRYGYERLMMSLRDYVLATKKTNGPARAIFTYPKLAKAEGSHRVYYLHDGVRQYVTHPLVFVAKGWNWQWVNTVSVTYLESFPEAGVIRPQ